MNGCERPIDYYKKLIAAYLNYCELVVQDSSFNQYEWARNQLDTIISNNPECGLSITIEILKRCENKKKLAFVAAGPLEDLLSIHGKKIFKTLKDAADSDSQIQLALSGVWLDEEEDGIYSEWENMMKKYGFIGDNPREAL